MKVQARLVQVARRPCEVRTPGERIDGVRRLLAVRHDRLGDLLLTLPAVAALRRTYPDARLGLMVRDDLAPLARSIRGVDEVVQAGFDPQSHRERIEAFAPDLVVCVSRGAGMARAASGARVPHRIGTGYRLYSPRFTRRVNERRSAGGRHECEYALSFAHRAGAAGNEAVFALSVSDEVDRATRAWIEEHDLEQGFVAIHPGSGGSCPTWPAGHFVDLAARLSAAGARPLFSIGPEDGAFDERLREAPDPVRRLPRFTGRAETLAGLLGKAALAISNSTGPLHLAAALGAPTLGLYAPWPTCAPARWGPYAANGWALVATCEEAQDWSRTRRRKDGDALLAELSPEDVQQEAVRLLEKRP